MDTDHEYTRDLDRLSKWFKSVGIDAEIDLTQFDDGPRVIVTFADADEMHTLFTLLCVGPKSNLSARMLMGIDHLSR